MSRYIPVLTNPSATPSPRVGRRHLFLPLASTLLIAASSVAARADAPADAAPALPVKSVTLFSSGVSYTMREGDVTGDATVPLTFRTTQINDILKSLVQIDATGSVRPVVYATKDPIGRTLQAFAVDVSKPTDRASLLNRLKGCQVEIAGGGVVIAAATVTDKFAISGQIVGVDREDAANPGNTGDVLSLLGDAGLQTVRLSEVRSIKFLDDRINHEFREALGLMAAGADDKRRQVTLHFDGTGKRSVQVGYVSEAPLWKISYRLLIGGAAGQKEEKAYLQGWALVENTTDEDWNGIHLSLVSGRPVSFIQDLYQPLYLPRPIVAPDVIASPFPQLAEANIEDLAGAVANGSFGGGGAGGRYGYAARGNQGVDQQQQSATTNLPGMGTNRSLTNNFTVSPAGSLDAAKASIVAEANGQKAGEMFAYDVDTPVTLPRQQAAMIPVVAQDIAGDKVSLYNADTDGRFPMDAYRLRNNTTLHLKGGPITIFDAGVYAGDARMEDIPPGDSRLVTYAVDLAVEAERQISDTHSSETAITMRRGVMTVSHHEQSKALYTLHNKADRPRVVLVEHPFDPDSKLMQPEKAYSRTATHYRFEVRVGAGKTEKLTVVTDRSISEDVALIDADAPVLAAYVSRDGVSEKVKAILRDLIARRRKVQDIHSEATEIDSEIKSIDTDQDRIRRNMSELDRNSALYKRYVDQLDQQETKIQTLRTQATNLRSQAAEAERAMKAYVDGVDFSA